MAVVSDEALEVKFRLYDGSDIGPIKYAPETTVVALKESVVSQWPQGSENPPKSYNDIKIINAGRILENNKTLAESRVPLGEIPGTPITMHVVLRPANAEKAAEPAPADAANSRCGCTIL